MKGGRGEEERRGGGEEGSKEMWEGTREVGKWEPVPLKYSLEKHQILELFKLSPLQNNEGL